MSASHVNDLQDEVVAVETGLRDGLAHDLKFTDATYDIGKSGATRPRDLFLSRNATVGGTLGVTGVATFTALPLINAGLQFPASQAASAGVNVLDDYEEGTWTPTDGSGAALSFTNVEGHYIKIGQLVLAAFALTFPATADGTAATFTGLPFTSQTIVSGNGMWGGLITFTNEATLKQLLVSSNALTFAPRTETGAPITNATLTTNIVRGVVVYRAST